MIYEPIPPKRCTKCLDWFPATLEYFAPQERGKMGLCARCRVCRAKQAKQWREDNAEYYGEYNRRHVREYNKAHPEQKKAQDRAWYDKNRDKAIARSREQYWNNLDRERANHVRYAHEHTEQAKQRAHRHYRKDKSRNHKFSREWNRNHPEASRAIKHKSRARRRAQIAASERHFTAADVERQYKAQKGHCYWCGIDVGNTYHVDHVFPLARGGSNGPENIVIACPPCNMSKNDKLPHEWTDKLL